MQNFKQIFSDSNFFKNVMLRRIFLVSVLLAISLPLSYAFFIHPSFKKLLIEDKKDDAVSIATHLSSLFPVEKPVLAKEDLSQDLLTYIADHKHHFDLVRMKIYSLTGKEIYSSDDGVAEEIHGEIFFLDLLKEGGVYTRVIEEESEPLEGQSSPLSMVETYVPLIKDKQFLGAFEIYYDITKRITQLNNLFVRSCLLLHSSAVALLALIAVALAKEHKSIVRRKRAEQALSEHIEFSQQLIDTIPSPIFYKDTNGKYLGCNSAFEKHLGFSKDDIIGKTVFDVASKEWADLYRQADLLLLNKAGTQIYETSLQYGDGTMHDVILNKATYTDASGALAGLVGVVTDITELKRTEEALRASENKLHLLSSHLMTVHERERRLISFELHDELGQSLTLLKLQLRAIERQLPEDQGALKKEVENTLKYVDKVLESVRRLSRDLSPSILEDLGLSAALRSMAEDFAAHTGMEASFDIENIDGLFSKEREILIYRICQESLTNIGKHAEARSISLAVDRGEREITLVLRDNGKGFDLSEVEASYSIDRGLGLAAMAERARMLEGSLEIFSPKGTGTRVTVTIPIESSGGLSGETLSYSVGG
jgi:PAS domain S-box-containing protein